MLFDSYEWISIKWRRTTLEEREREKKERRKKLNWLFVAVVVVVVDFVRNQLFF